jgi:hypothetical protein
MTEFNRDFLSRIKIISTTVRYQLLLTKFQQVDLKGNIVFLINKLAIIACLFVVLFAVNSCEKEDTGSFVSQAEIVAEYVRAEDYSTNLFGLMHSSIHDTALINNGHAIIDSVYVSYQMDTITGIATFLYDFDAPDQPSSTRNIYSGQVTAKLSEPFGNTGAVMWATFNNYMVNNYLLQGVIYYENTGETIESKKKYLLQ